MIQKRKLKQEEAQPAAMGHSAQPNYSPVYLRATEKTLPGELSLPIYLLDSPMLPSTNFISKVSVGGNSTRNWAQTSVLKWTDNYPGVQRREEKMLDLSSTGSSVLLRPLNVNSTGCHSCVQHISNTVRERIKHYCPLSKTVHPTLA